jgi:putative phage-type endonuclease
MNLTREEWLAERQKGIGGSDIPAILGIDRFRTPLDVFLEKTNRSQTEDNKYMYAGRKLEPVIADMFHDQTGYNVIIPDKQFYIHPENQLFRASIDRIYEYKNTLNILECKSTQMPVSEPFEPHYVQLQWYLGVMNCEKGALAYLERGLDFTYFEFDRKNDFIEYLQEEALNFWNKHILTDTPPEPSNAADVLKLYHTHKEGQVYEATEEDYHDYLELNVIKANIKKMEEREEQIKEKIKLNMLDAEMALYSGSPIVSWKSSIVNRFDTTAFKKSHPALHQEFTKQSEQRRFLVK